MQAARRRLVQGQGRKSVHRSGSRSGPMSELVGYGRGMSAMQHAGCVWQPFHSTNREEGTVFHTFSGKSALPHARLSCLYAKCKWREEQTEGIKGPYAASWLRSHWDHRYSEIALMSGVLQGVNTGFLERKGQGGKGGELPFI